MTEPINRQSIDPELLGFLDGFPPLVLSMDNLAEVRALSRTPPPLFADPGHAVVTRWLEVPGPTGAPPVRLAYHRPAATRGPAPCILHLHGGGYVLGAPDAEAPQHRAMAAELGCCVVSVDYRLAPETPFPGGLEDAYVALVWIAAEADRLEIDRARIGVMGESAGGGLAAALALLARDRGGPSLAFQHLIYPMIDDRTCREVDPHPHVGQALWTRHNNRFGWSALLGGEPGVAGVSPYAAAARATELAGLPPTFVSTGALDLFLEEDLDYARRLTRAGVAVELHVYPRAFHGFDYDPSASVSKRARRDSWDALARALAA